MSINFGYAFLDGFYWCRTGYFKKKQHMWNLVKNFMGNHKKKVITGGVVIAACGAGWGYYKIFQKNKKKGELRDYYVNCMKDLYGSNQKTAETAIDAILPQTFKGLNSSLNLEDIITELRTKKSTMESTEKQELWEKAKLTCFSRLVVASYGSIMVKSLLKLKVFMIGRYLFINHIEKSKNLENPHVPKKAIAELNEDTQQKFLSYALHFQNVGMKILCDIVFKHVTKHFKSVVLLEKYSSTEIINLINKVRNDVEKELFSLNGKTPKIATLLLATEDKEKKKNMDKNLVALVNEIRDILDSQEFAKVFLLTANNAFTFLYDNIEKSVFKKNESFGKIEKEETKIVLPSIISKVSREAKSFFKTSEECEDGETFAIPELEKFCFLVYSMGIEF